MPQTIETVVYTYQELLDREQDSAIERARSWYIQGQFDDSYWYESTKEEAANLGIDIISFDCDRGNCIKGKLTKSAYDIAAAIKIDHGETCETFKTADAFLKQLAALEAQYNTDDENVDDDAIENFNNAKEELEEEFKKAILEDYLTILKNEVEYIQSEEAVKEGMEANGYTFTAEGRRYG